jgi:DNA-binding GntR family transcriptional regulator
MSPDAGPERAPALAAAPGVPALPVPGLPVPGLPVPAPTLEEAVYSRLRRAIVEGDLAPGQEIKVAPTAVQMGVSRIPLMKACQRLVGEGLLVANPRKRVTVRALTEARIVEGKEVLLALEFLALEHAARELTADGFARLEALNQAVRGHRLPAGVVGPNRPDHAFHEALWQAAGQPLLLEEIRRVYDHNEPARALGHRRPQPERSAAEHALVIAALRRRDVPAAQGALRAHRERGTAVQIDILRTLDGAGTACRGWGAQSLRDGRA